MKWYWIVIIITIILLAWTLSAKSTEKGIKDKINENISKIPSEYNANIKMNGMFDKIYLIALPKKKEYALNALSSFDIHPDLIDPIWKDDLSDEELIRKNILSPDYDYKNMGRVACYLSHLKTLTTFLRDPIAQTALIFEDDIKECPNKKIYNRRLSSLKDELKYVDGKWDVLYLGGDSSTCTDMESVTYQMYTKALPYQLHAYSITRKGAQIVLRETIPVYAYGDHMYRDLNKNGKLNVLSVIPSIFIQNRSELGSDLGSHEKLRECKEFSRDSSLLLIELKLSTADPLKFDSLPLARPDSSVKYIHQSWKDYNIPQKFKKWVQSWKTHYPGSQYILWTDKDNS